MKLGIMQPYFFPYLGYFSLIKATDRWVILDDVQFIRHGWIERNRVLNSQGSWQYIKVPLIKHPRNTLIKDVKIRTTEPWVDTILAQLTCYKRKAPYYDEIMGFLQDTLSYKTDSITHLNAHVLARTCALMDIHFQYTIFSQSSISLPRITHPGDWALHISKAMHAKEYINPINGKELFDASRFEENGIQLSLLKPTLKPYNQKLTTFESGLSIIDVLMFNGPTASHEMLNEYETVSH